MCMGYNDIHKLKIKALKEVIVYLFYLLFLFFLTYILVHLNIK